MRGWHEQHDIPHSYPIIQYSNFNILVNDPYCSGVICTVGTPFFTAPLFVGGCGLA